jgi:hypothetical protein
LAELHGRVIHAQDVTELVNGLKAWISNSLARVSADLAGLVEASETISEFQRFEASQMPVTASDVRLLRSETSKPCGTSNQQELFDNLESLLHRLLYFYLDLCPSCQYDRYLAANSTLDDLVVVCPLCGLTPFGDTAKESWGAQTTHPVKRQRLVEAGVWSYLHDPDSA